MNDDTANEQGPDGLARRSVLRTAGTLVGLGVAGSAAAEPPGVRNPPGDVPTCGSASNASPRPGPSVLYDSPAVAPQFENGPGWSADPLLVSGATGYDGGEFRYQDWIYDDHGADTSPTRTPPTAQPSNTVYGGATGDYVYPTDDRYRHNAADLLEVRCRVVDAPADSDRDEEVAYRVTLNTMVEPDAAIVALGIDTGADNATISGNSEAVEDWGYGLGDLGAPVEHRVVTWGTGAELDGEALDDDRVSVDTDRNQLEVRVPLEPPVAGSDEGVGGGGESGAAWRHYCVTGIHDGDGAFAPVVNRPTADQPGGANGSDAPPVFNVGFRRPDQEPMGAPNFDEDTAPGDLSGEVEDAQLNGSRAVGFGHWREHGQAQALADRLLLPFHADIDFAKLREGVTEVDVPTEGFVDRLYASRVDLAGLESGTGAGPYEYGEGIEDRTGNTDQPVAGRDIESPSSGHEDVLSGRVQPYSVYVPSDYDPEAGAPLHVNPHSLSGTYNQYEVYSPDLIRELGEERGAMILTPEARGPGQWYHDAAELAVFEAWADLRARYAVDEDRVTVGGYSMGGYATYRFCSHYPDLFAKGFATVGPPDEAAEGGPTNGAAGSRHNVMQVSDNLRHVPLLMWNGANDELVPVTGPINYAQQLRDHGYPHELDIFPGYDHFLFAVRDNWKRGKRFLEGAFLGDGRVTRAPERVTYRAVPAMDAVAPELRELGLVHDGAYWVHEIEPRDGADSGLVDALSRAEGYAPPRTENFRGLGTDPDPHLKRGTRVHEGPAAGPGANQLEVTLEGVGTATCYVEEAGLDPARPLTLVVESDGPATLTLAGSFGGHEVTVDAGVTERTFRLCTRGQGGSDGGHGNGPGDGGRPVEPPGSPDDEPTSDVADGGTDSDGDGGLLGVGLL